MSAATPAGRNCPSASVSAKVVNTPWSIAARAASIRRRKSSHAGAMNIVASAVERLRTIMLLRTMPPVCWFGVRSSRPSTISRVVLMKTLRSTTVPPLPCTRPATVRRARVPAAYVEKAVATDDPLAPARDVEACRHVPAQARVLEGACLDQPSGAAVRRARLAPIGARQVCERSAQSISNGWVLKRVLAAVRSLHAVTNRAHPRPRYGMPVAITVMNGTLASTGSPAMNITASTTCERSRRGSTAVVPLGWRTPWA